MQATTIFTLPKLLTAYLSCRRHKRKSSNALLFELFLETKLLKLQEDLRSHTYRPRRSICFAVTHPKLREIFAADFCDRIIHHLLINEIEPYFERRFIFASFACRKEKGCHAAVSHLRKHINLITKNKTQNAYFLQLDIKSYFPAIDKNILFGIIEKNIHQKELIWLAKIIIFHDPTQNYRQKGKKELLRQIPPNKSLFGVPKTKGLPIGNLTSQFFANVYLNKLDQFIKRKLKIKHYLRYVDDLILLSENPDQLWQWRKEISLFLAKTLQLELHPDKDKFGSVYQGIDFLGYVTKPTYTLTRNRVVNNLKTKLYYFNKNVLVNGAPDKKAIKTALSMINSYYGHFLHGNCYRLRRNIYEKHFGALKEYLTPARNYSYFHYGKPR